MFNLEFIESATESLLGVLRRRDDEALHKLTATIANLSREKSRELSSAESRELSSAESRGQSSGEDRERLSYELGAIEALESLAVRAAARAPMNARFEVMRRRHALDVLQFLAKAPQHTGTPTQLAEALQQQRSNISRLIEAMIRVGVVKRVNQLPDAAVSDARLSPVQVTSAGLEMLEGLKPNWRSAAVSFRTVHTQLHPLFEQGIVRVSHHATAYVKDIGPGMMKIETLHDGRILTAMDRAGVTRVINVTEAHPHPNPDPRSTTTHLTTFERPEPKGTAYVAVKTAH
jgi:DNA-binding MarR family transcriptional regulator